MNTIDAQPTGGTTMRIRTLTRLALVIAIAATARSSAIAAGATHARSLRVRIQLTVINTTATGCHAGICTINTHGNGRVTHFGKVTFTTRITADGNLPPCGVGSHWVRATRTIHTDKGDLVLHEAGLQCPQPGGPRVDLVWTLDSADSTGVFAGARGRGSDVAHPAQNTAAARGTITLPS